MKLKDILLKESGHQRVHEKIQKREYTLHDPIYAMF